MIKKCVEYNENLEKNMEILSKGAFLTTKTGNKVNSMTIAWGSIGFIWGKPVFMVMVRPQRYTYEFIQTAKDYTISIPYSDEMKKALTICGTKSGRDIDKEKEANIKFVPAKLTETPVVDNCNMYYECKITYVDRIHKDSFPEELKKNYPKDDYHYIYYGEIVECYAK